MQGKQLVENSLKDWDTMDTLSDEVSHTHALKTGNFQTPHDFKHGSSIIPPYNTDFLGARRLETVE